MLFDRVAAVVQDTLGQHDDHHHFLQLLTLQLIILLFADDVALLALSAKGLERLYLAFRAFCKENHLDINRDKTQAMVTRQGPPTLQLGDDSFVVVDSFRYLGVTVDAKGNPNTISA